MARATNIGIAIAGLIAAAGVITSVVVSTPPAPPNVQPTPIVTAPLPLTRSNVGLAFTTSQGPSTINLALVQPAAPATFDRAALFIHGRFSPVSIEDVHDSTNGDTYSLAASVAGFAGPESGKGTLVALMDAVEFGQSTKHFQNDPCTAAGVNGTINFFSSDVSESSDTAPSLPSYPPQNANQQRLLLGSDQCAHVMGATLPLTWISEISQEVDAAVGYLLSNFGAQINNKVNLMGWSSGGQFFGNYLYQAKLGNVTHGAAIQNVVFISPASNNLQPPGLAAGRSGFEDPTADCPTFDENTGVGTSITAASNASPIQITTSTPHGLTTGKKVYIVAVQGNTAANGLFTVTFVDANNFTLNGTTGNGAFVGGTGASALQACATSADCVTGGQTCQLDSLCHSSCGSTTLPTCFTCYAPWHIGNYSAVIGSKGRISVNANLRNDAPLAAPFQTSNQAQYNAQNNNFTTCPDCSDTTSAGPCGTALNGSCTWTGTACVGRTCAVDSDCPLNTTSAYGTPITWQDKRCVRGAGASGGLGCASSCTRGPCMGVNQVNPTAANTQFSTFLTNDPIGAAYTCTGRATVTAATNASPVQITTNHVHGLTEGATVTVAGVLVNTGANGTFPVHVVDTLNFTLVGSVGNGVYGGGGEVDVPSLCCSGSGSASDVAQCTPGAITAATNASPIQITTAQIHNLNTGDFVSITGVQGNTAANVTNIAVTRVSTTQFTLNGTTGNGAYTVGGVVTGAASCCTPTGGGQCCTVPPGRIRAPNWVRQGWNSTSQSNALAPGGSVLVINGGNDVTTGPAQGCFVYCNMSAHVTTNIAMSVFDCHDHPAYLDNPNYNLVQSWVANAIRYGVYGGSLGSCQIAPDGGANVCPTGQVCGGDGNCHLSASVYEVTAAGSVAPKAPLHYCNCAMFPSPFP